MSENTGNKDELGAAYLQEMYEVNGKPEDVSVWNKKFYDGPCIYALIELESNRQNVTKFMF